MVNLSTKRLGLALGCIVMAFVAFSANPWGDSFGALVGGLRVVLVIGLSGIAVSLLCGRVWPGVYVSLLLALLALSCGLVVKMFLDAFRILPNGATCHQRDVKTLPA